MRTLEGELREILPTDTLWYMLYIANPLRNKRLFKQFRFRFRMPYKSFLSLSDELVNHDILSRYVAKDGTCHNSTNLRLLVLGVLRYIGCGWTFDDVSEANGMSDDLNREFMYSFLKYGSTVLYKKWVIDENIENTVMQDLMVALARLMLLMLGCYHVLFGLKLNIRDSN